MLKGKPEKMAQGLLPPYVAYSTWQRMLEELRVNIPSRIDTSYFEHLKLSGSTRSMLKGALVFLGLITSDGTPAAELRQLVHSEGGERKAVLGQVVRQAYGPFFAELDLEHITMGQMREYLRSRGATGDIGRKCLSFFLSIAADAGMSLSPHLANAKRGRRPKAAAAKITRKQIPPAPPAKPPLVWEELLLKKFPDFDPSWSDEAKQKWFDDFAELVKRLTASSE